MLLDESKQSSVAALIRQFNDSMLTKQASLKTRVESGELDGRVYYIRLVDLYIMEMISLVNAIWNDVLFPMIQNSPHHLSVPFSAIKKELNIYIEPLIQDRDQQLFKEYRLSRTVHRSAEFRKKIKAALQVRFLQYEKEFNTHCKHEKLNKRAILISVISLLASVLSCLVSLFSPMLEHFLRTLG